MRDFRAAAASAPAGRLFRPLELCQEKGIGASDLCGPEGARGPGRKLASHSAC